MATPAKERAVESFWEFAGLAAVCTLACLYTARNIWLLFGELDPMCEEYYALSNHRPLGDIDSIDVPAILWCYLAYVPQAFALVATASTIHWIVWACRQPPRADFKFGHSRDVLRTEKAALKELKRDRTGRVLPE
jgi:hypothetical protein